MKPEYGCTLQDEGMGADDPSTRPLRFEFMLLAVIAAAAVLGSKKKK